MRPGGDEGWDDKTSQRVSPAAATRYTDRIRSCEVGFCTNGEEDKNVPFPPPPPPFKVPPQPGMPGIPPKPPEKDDDASIEEEDYTHDYFTPSPPPTSPPAPVYPLYLHRVRREGICPIPAGNVTKDGEMPEFAAECSDLGNEVMVGFSGMDYTDVKGCNNTHAMTPLCAQVPARADSKAPCVTKLTALMPLTEDGVDAIMSLEVPAVCPTGYGMIRWRAIPDNRAWYIRRKEPGLFRIEYSCCPTPGQGLCAERATSCVLDEKDKLESLIDSSSSLIDPQISVGCLPEMDEVMLGWRVTEEGCSEGKRKAVASCCSIDPSANATEHDKSLIRAMNSNADAFKAGNVNSVLDFAEDMDDLGEFTSSSNSRGIAVDGVYLEEGASYLSAPESSSPHEYPAYLADSFNAIKQPPTLDATDHVHVNDAASKIRNKFCTFQPEDMGDSRLTSFSYFLTNCATNRNDDTPGNALLRVKYRVAVGFDAPWQFRMEVHGFAGALIIRRVGQSGVVASMKAKMFSVKDSLLLASLTAELEIGVYDIEAYSAYDAKTAAIATSGTAKHRDAVYFRQSSYCGVSRWTLLEVGMLKSCGGGTRRQPLPKVTSPSPVGNVKKVHDPQKDGLYFSMKVSTDLKAKDNHFMLQGRITILFFMLEIDITIKMGSAADGGGMFIGFEFIWKVGRILLGEIKGYMDLIPLDFASIKEGGFSALLDIKFAMGLSIKPHILNYAMEIVEVIVKAIIRMILIPFLYIVQGLQIALEYAIIAVQAQRKIVRAARRFLDRIEAAANRRLSGLEAKEKVYSKAEEAYRMGRYLILRGQLS